MLVGHSAYIVSASGENPENEAWFRIFQYDSVGYWYLYFTMSSNLVFIRRDPTE